MLLVTPSPALLARLPNGKLPDRADFKLFCDDTRARVAAWSRAVKESERLRDEFANWAQCGRSQEALALV